MFPQVSQWGINSPSANLDVTCPVVLPSQPYSTAYFTVHGYNRTSTDNVKCSFTAADVFGGSYIIRTAVLPANQSGSQYQKWGVPMNGSATNPNNLVSISCHLPAGENYLTGIMLQMAY